LAFGNVGLLFFTATLEPFGMIAEVGDGPAGAVDCVDVTGKDHSYGQSDEVLIGMEGGSELADIEVPGDSFVFSFFSFVVAILCLATFGGRFVPDFVSDDVMEALSDPPCSFAAVAARKGQHWIDQSLFQFCNTTTKFTV
jgi:hypothetical protein